MGTGQGVGVRGIGGVQGGRGSHFTQHQLWPGPHTYYTIAMLLHPLEG